MSTSISIGFSQDLDPQKAAVEACVQIQEQNNPTTTDLVILFASVQYVVPEILSAITRILKPKHLVGSSTGGIIISDGVTSRGIAIVAINSDEMRFGISAINDVDGQDMYYTGFNLARKASQDLNTSHRDVFITFSQGIEKNSSSFIRGVKEALGGVFPVIGAISSDDFKNEKVSQFFQDGILRHSVVGLLLGGSFPPALGCKHGFKPLGKPRTVTKIDGNIIRTIDNRPAVDIYRHFLGDEAEVLKNTGSNSHAATYPLGFYLDDARQYLLRNVVDILGDGSIVCHEGIPQGAEVHLMIGNKESCRNSAIEAAELVKNSLGDRQAKLILVFESLSRYKILGPGAFAEIKAIKDVLGHATPIVGMYSNGEIGPFGTLNNAKNIYLHNDHILIVAIA